MDILVAVTIGYAVVSVIAACFTILFTVSTIRSNRRIKKRQFKICVLKPQDKRSINL